MRQTHKNNQSHYFGATTYRNIGVLLEDVNTQNDHSKENFESDFWIGADDPDNIRRQNQNYFDYWEMAHQDNTHRK